MICLIPDCAAPAGDPALFFGLCVDHWIRTPCNVRAPAWRRGDGAETQRLALEHFRKEGSMEPIKEKKKRNKKAAPEGDTLAEILTDDAPITPAEATRAEVEACELLAQVQSFAIETREDLELAAEVLAESKGRARVLETRLQEITRPLNAALSSARDLFRPALTHYSTIERDIKNRIALFHAHETTRNAAALAAASASHVEGDSEGVSAALARVAHVAHVEGVSVRYSWTFTVYDLASVPREFLAIDPDKVKFWIKSTGRKDSAPYPIPGITFEKKASVASRAT